MIIGRDAFIKNQPQIGDKYYTITNGIIEKCIWNTSPEDIGRYRIGNCYNSEEDAKYNLNRQITLTRLKNFANANNSEIDWSSKEKKYFLTFKKNLNCIEIVESDYVVYGDLVFSSYEIAQTAISEIGAENIKKYYFSLE